MAEMKPLYNLLLSTFAEKLSNNEFIFNKTRKDSYERLFDNGRHGIFVLPIYHVDDFDVVMKMSIHYENLESLVKSISPDYLVNFKYGKNFKLYSVGIELGNYLGTGQKRWHIKSEQDVMRVADDLYANFLEYALTYFEKYSNLKNAFELILDNQGKGSSHCVFNEARCTNHVAMAMLLGFNQAEINKIIDDDTQYLSSLAMKHDTAKYDLESFLKFVEKAKKLPEWPD
jgi:hypothetical protein